MLLSGGQAYVLSRYYSLSPPLRRTPEGCRIQKSSGWHRLLLLLGTGRAKAGSHVRGIGEFLREAPLLTVQSDQLLLK